MKNSHLIETLGLRARPERTVTARNRTAAVAQAQPQRVRLKQESQIHFNAAFRCERAAAGLAPQPRSDSLTSTLALWTVAFLLTTPAARAQYAPPPPPQPFGGFLNEGLRKNDPYMAAWD